MRWNGMNLLRGYGPWLFIDVAPIYTVRLQYNQANLVVIAARSTRR